MSRLAHILARLAAGAVCVVVAAGCGSSAGGSEGASPSSASGKCAVASAGTVGGKSHTLFLGGPDVTYSTKHIRSTYLPDMVTFARMAANSKSPFYADAFTGAPENTTDYPVSCDFSVTPKAFGGNKDLGDSYLRSEAKNLRPELKKLLDKPGARGGSPLLNVLALSDYTLASHPGAKGCIAVFTDAGVFEPEFNIHRFLSPQERTGLVQRWAPKLKALRQARVYIVGVGRGSRMSLDQLEYVRSVLTELLERVGAKLAVFDSRLPDNAQC